jgi:TPR repeat protein
MSIAKHVFQFLAIALILAGCQTVKPAPVDALSDRHAKLEMHLNALDMDDPNLRFSEVRKALRAEGYGEADFKVLADLNNSNAQVLYGSLFRFDDDPKSRRYYSPACNAGNMFACRAMGFSFNNYMNHEKTIVESDYDASKPYFEKACRADNALSCRALGNLYQFGHGVDEDIDRARALYEKSCDLGNYFGCNDLGVLYMDGRGVSQDFEKAKTLFEYACEGTKFGCHNLLIVEKKMKRAST